MARKWSADTANLAQNSLARKFFICLCFSSLRRGAAPGRKIICIFLLTENSALFYSDFVRRENEMTKEEILKGIEAMQRIQQSNPPSSEKWQRASTVLRELVKRLTGKYPQDACGK